MKKITVLICGFLIGLPLAVPAFAASIYAPVYHVNNSVITKYEMEQRIKMLESFGTQGDLRKMATDQLINDRLRLQAAKDAGISTTQDEINAGMEEFAARGSFSTEQLLSYFNERGISRESFVDFVRAGLLWRNVVTARFASKVNVTDNEVDSTLNVNAISFPKTVNVAEIVLPIAQRGPAQTLALANRLSQTLKGNIQFSIAAKKFSKSDTALRGGDMGWIPFGTLPAQVSSRLSKMEIGQVSAPINQDSAIVIYQLRGIREAKSAGEQVVSVSYMQVALPVNKAGQSGQISTAQKLINASDTCLDLQANTAKFGDNAVTTQSLPVNKVPASIGAELAKLDPNEAGYFVTENGSINILMLCNRAKDLPAGAREQIRNALFSRRVGSFGDGYLQELRGDAIIIKK